MFLPNLHLNLTFPRLCAGLRDSLLDLEYLSICCRLLVVPRDMAAVEEVEENEAPRAEPAAAAGGSAAELRLRRFSLPYL